MGQTVIGVSIDSALRIRCESEVIERSMDKKITSKRLGNYG